MTWCGMVEHGHVEPNVKDRWLGIEFFSTAEPPKADRVAIPGVHSLVLPAVKEMQLVRVKTGNAGLNAMPCHAMPCGIFGRLRAMKLLDHGGTKIEKQTVGNAAFWVSYNPVRAECSQVGHGVPTIRVQSSKQA